MQVESTTEEHVHDMWEAVAGGWDEHAAYVDARGAAAAARLLELTAPRPGERVLELACGPGGLGIAAAALVGAEGEVVVSDVAPEMTAIAGRRAAELGLEQVIARDARPRARSPSRTRRTTSCSAVRA